MLEKVRPHHRELRALIFSNSVWGLQRPTELMNKGCETGPPAYRPYPRRLKSPTVCRCSYKGSTFLSVGPTGVELANSRETARCSTNWAPVRLKFDRFQTLRNNSQQHRRTCNRVCKQTQHITSNNTGSCWPTITFAAGLSACCSFA